MGQEIIYCGTCGTRITSTDLEKGKAFRIEDMNFCASCAPAKVPESRPHTPATGTARIKRASGATPLKGVNRITTRASATVPDRAPNKTILFGIGAGVLLLVFILFLALRSDDSGQPAPQPPATSAPPPKDAPSSTPAPKNDPLQRVRDWCRNHPDDLIGQLREYETVQWELPPSRIIECRKELDAVKASLQKKLDVELRELDAKISAPLEAKDFSGALAILNDARNRHNTQLWILGVDKKIGRVETLHYEAGPAPKPPPTPKPEPPPTPKPKPPPTPLPSSLEKGLLGWWRFNEGSGNKAADASGNGHQAILKNNIRWDKKGGGFCLYFDNKNDILEIPHAPGLNVGAKSFSVSFRIQIDTLNPRRVIVKQQGQTGWYIDVNCNMNELRAPGRLRVGLLDGNTHQWVFHAGLVKRRWYHVAATIDRERNELKVYRDGTQVEKTIDTSSVKGSLDSNAPLNMGFWPNKKAQPYLKGSLDNVRLYDRALDPGDVSALAR